VQPGLERNPPEAFRGLLAGGISLPFTFTSQNATPKFTMGYEYKVGEKNRMRQTRIEGRFLGLHVFRKIVAYSVLVLLLSAGGAVNALSGEGQISKTLYERLGGVKSIAALTDDLIDRLYVNPVINANPVVQEIHLNLHPSVAKFMFTEYFCQAAGGPCTYIGRSMKEAHAGLNIAESEWKEMLVEFGRTLDKFKIGPDERRDLMGIVDYTKVDIIASAGMTECGNKVLKKFRGVN
jgi:hemoglobin